MGSQRRWLSNCLLLVVLVNIAASSSDPGLLFTVGGAALADGVDVQLPGILSEKISGLEIASISGTTRELLFLNISYNLTNIVIHSFTTESFAAEFVDHGIELTLSGIAMTVTCDWTYDNQSLFFIHISDSGTANMESDEGSYEMKILLKQHEGRPEISLSKNKLDLKHFHLDLDGGADWFYNLFDFIIAPLVEDEIEDVVEGIIDDLVDEANDILDSIPLPFPLPADISYNWGMTSDFDTDDDGWGTLPTEGIFTATSDLDGEPPFVLANLPDHVSNQTFEAVLSQFTAESLGWALWEAGSLNITVPFGTTNDFRLLVPSLYQAFPDAPLSVTIACLAYPVVEFSSANGIDLNVAPYMYWNVDLGNGTLTNAFVLIVETQAQLALAFEGITLKGALSVPTLELILQDTNIGSFSLFSLNAAFQSVVNLVLLPAANSILQSGLAAPTIAGFTLLDPAIEFVDGSYAFFTSSFQSIFAANSTGVSESVLTSQVVSIASTEEVLDMLQRSLAAWQA